ncbi:NF038130 family PEP-CTERM protein [Okeania sp. SIO1I7]|uniref:NF038130 family PEP-CTERM protein n=1 Tax=Okeania sp. SIO1I7 TaxID=2607772 RepID=UPI0013FBE4E3|nr:NF038130 family PEP-CTERM protein [Okeania sp. SIO1I7]NET27202.1 PEP-CTERM sorting domain-containing protein [Okeania sp. SIO1I7]
MAGLVKKFLASASVVAGMSAVFGAPAMAASITSATVTGPNVVYSDDGTGDLDPNLPGVDLTYILQNANYGNVELSGQLGDPNAVDMMTATELEVLFDDGSDVTFRSMTWNDWTGDLNGDGSDYDFFYQWLNDGIANEDSGLGDVYSAAYNYNLSIGDPNALNKAYTQTANAAFSELQRISDPNVAIVQKKGNGDIFFQLAGHRGHSSGFNFSEVVAVEVDNVFQGYYYKFGVADELATVFDDDSEGSHEGLYNFTITSGGGILSESIPEPSTLLGLMAVGGLVAVTKRKSQK